jgi:Kef-type K+ transport system membrane component KefB
MLSCVGPEVVVAPIMAVFIVIFALLFAVPVFLFKVFLWWRVFSKAGHSGAFSLLILAPFGTIIMLCILAFSEWPKAKKLQ